MRWISAAALAAVLAVMASGCGDKCNDETPPVRANGLPTCPSMAAGVPVTVQLGVCPRCDQGSPRCEVRLENVGSGAIQLEPLSEVCEASSSCPIVDPASCPLTPLTCAFTTPGVGNYQLVVVEPSGTPRQVPFTVAATGSNSCTL